jgi:murein DD-endopeptidase MepM/ murein hydrolase activator NlpD
MTIIAASAFLTGFCRADHIDRDKDRWKPMYINANPQQMVNTWQVPFKTRDRKDIKTISVVSTFGAKRLSYIKGHFHTALDMIPKKKQETSVYVYPMAHGVVCSIHLGPPHTTVVVKHKLPDGSTLFTSYKHLGDVYVQNGQQVTPYIKVGRLYTRKEAKALGGNYDHLHLEVRKSFDDYGVASWATMTREDLDRRFLDPLKFMKTNIN